MGVNFVCVDCVRRMRFIQDLATGQPWNMLTLLLGVAQYTDVTVWYVPRFGGHGLIRLRYNRKKKKIYYARFLFIYFEQTVVQITIFFHLDEKILNIITLYI